MIRRRQVDFEIGEEPFAAEPIPAWSGDGDPVTADRAPDEPGPIADSHRRGGTVRSPASSVATALSPVRRRLAALGGLVLIPVVTTALRDEQ